jgi:hypothetical protein
LGLEESLDGAHHFAASGAGLEHLPDETLEGQAQGIDAMAAAGTAVLGGQQGWGQQVAEVLGEGEQIELTHGAGRALAQGGEAGAPLGEEGGGFHIRR